MEDRPPLTPEQRNRLIEKAETSVERLNLGGRLTEAQSNRFLAYHEEIVAEEAARIAEILEIAIEAFPRWFPDGPPPGYPESLRSPGTVGYTLALILIDATRTHRISRTDLPKIDTEDASE